MSAQETLYRAVKYALDRTQTDPDFRWVCGWGTEAFHRLCVAEAEHLGKPLEEIEKTRTVDLQPDYRKREPEILVLRKRIEELGG
jgi:hypothetical protein